MSDYKTSQLVDYLVVLNRQERKFTSETGTRWGGLIEPGQGENPEKTDAGLRIVLFGSWEFGYLALETLKAYESRYPGEVNLVGFITDDPLNPDAKISLKKRIWGLLDMPERVIDETTIIESALSHGVPVYTGEIKNDPFRKLLQQWKPDAIFVCVFGQVIDRFIADIPPYGIYNFHPSELARNFGAGPAPYDDLAGRRAETTVWTVHHVSEEIDSGHIVGQSPPICVLNVEGNLPGDPFLVYNKIAEPLSPMVFIMARELRRKHRLKETSFIDSLNFFAVYPEKSREKLMQRINRENHVNFFLEPVLSLFF
ncbi:MAG: formyltransferase family protein [Bacteroidota bacterium]